MYDWECTSPEHFLFGTVLVKVMDRESGNPVEGISVAIADDLETARKKG